ncbi:hypothetical protein Tco_0466266 [Tanacetum coccineum]
MIACCGKKTAQNADFISQHRLYSTGCSINLVFSSGRTSDLIGPWLQQFWATAFSHKITTLDSIYVWRRSLSIGSRGEQSTILPLGLQVKQAALKALQTQSAAHSQSAAAYLNVLHPSMVLLTSQGLLTHKGLLTSKRQDAAGTPDLERKSDGTKKLIEEKKLLMTLYYEMKQVPSKPTPPIQIMDSEEQHNAAEVPMLLSLDQEVEHLLSHTIDNLNSQLKLSVDAKKKERGLKNLKKNKAKTRTLRKPTSSCSRKKSNDEFPKRLYPMDSEKEREMLKERDAKRLLRKRKATISEEQPSKKPKLRTETMSD